MRERKLVEVKREVQPPQRVTTTSHSQQTCHGACGLTSAVEGSGRRLDQSEFPPMPEVTFRVPVSPANAKRKETSGSTEIARLSATDIDQPLERERHAS